MKRRADKCTQSKVDAEKWICNVEETETCISRGKISNGTREIGTSGCEIGRMLVSGEKMKCKNVRREEGRP